ncbi:MAG: thioesterase family protein [Rhodobacteraceae bacterium]|nr:thioesterase family protein [Paracoccaceae bacterium]
MTNKAAIIGGGEIGGGWAARFLLNGWDVALFDPDPEAETALANARRSLPGLNDVALPAEGRLTHTETITGAVDGAIWIQVCMPDHLESTQRLLAEIQGSCRLDAVIAVSSSGFKPSELQTDAPRPEQIIVCQPFAPVYLLPLAEVAGIDGPAAATVKRAGEILLGLGMKPVLVQKENATPITSRLGELVWQEAISLIGKGVVSASDIDDIFSHGIGLSLAQAGLFEIPSIAGDPPKPDTELLKTSAERSMPSSAQHPTTGSEHIRDNNLVAILRALKGRNRGAGALLNRHDAALRKAAPPVDFSKPLRVLERVVPIDWTDFNGHMNEARYLESFSMATDRLMAIISDDADYIASGNSYFTAETHIRHIDEAHAGDPIHVEIMLLSGQGKRLHVFNSLYHADGRLLATGEQMLLHVSLQTRRTTEPSAAIAARLAMIEAHHAKLPRPEGVGNAIRQRHRTDTHS